MNKLLQLKKNTLILALIFISLFIFFSIVTNKFYTSNDRIVTKKSESSFDIINPSFTIDDKKEKISVKAKNGNFIDEDIILLENNVIFKSVNFQLLSDKVFFNKNDDTAESKERSKFKSDGTEIKSEGFKITENGNTIYFNGKSTLIIDKD